MITAHFYKMGRAAADDRSRGKSYSSAQRGFAARREVQSASAAALRAARLQCEFSLGGCKGGVSLFKKEMSLPYTLPEKISIASEQLKELQCLPIALPARGVAALALQDDLPLLLLSAAALLIL